ncbi:MAG: hypothetical protein KJN93_08230 [Alphaproteobacteria bacterium]|nr:hypothetical protein [Alphaproteobacteria bacterium]
MFSEPLAYKVKRRLKAASMRLGTADPVASMDGLLSRTFVYPEGDPRYARNELLPMAPPFEPSFSEEQPGNLRYTIEPLPPEVSGSDRRDEATREMRRMIREFVGREALYWFDRSSEAHRGFSPGGHLSYGAFMGTSHDRGGLQSSKVYYELPHGSGSIDGLPPNLYRIVMTALGHVPGLVPLFTTIAATRAMGEQRLTFAVTRSLKLADLQPLLDALGIGHQLGGIIQTLGLVLGGRFELPPDSALLAFGEGPDGPCFEIYVLLTAIPDVPPSFLSLLTMGMAERPAGLRALERWIAAFTPEDAHWPGNFTIISLKTSRTQRPKVSLYLRPIEFDMSRPAETAA